MYEIFQNYASVISVLAGVTVGFFLNFLCDTMKEKKEKTKYLRLFKSDLASMDRKINHIMNEIHSEAQSGTHRESNQRDYFRRFNFDELTRFYDMNYERLYYFNEETVKKVNTVYFHIKNAKDFFENKYDAKNSCDELDRAIKGIDPATKALDSS
ncbi:MAG: hypothetical protein PHQ81_08910, partial [Methanofollis sp.]|nr:hypothetical protein [Methanofollis sp.]